MNHWIALFRGINVGGHNKLPMAELRTQMSALGFANTRTYIASGNLLFEAEESDPTKLATQIATSVEKHHGFAAKVLVITKARLTRVIEQCPFNPTQEDARHLHVFFWAEPGMVKSIDPFNALKTASDQIHLTDDAFYLFCPDGLGKSKLGAAIERIGKCAATARNWRTVHKLSEMAAQ